MKFQLQTRLLVKYAKVIILESIENGCKTAEIDGDEVVTIISEKRQCNVNYYGVVIIPKYVIQIWSN